jgi:hypothetical protein
MTIVPLIHQYLDQFYLKYGDQLLPSQQAAINAMLRCRTPASGELHVHCHQCQRSEWRPLSCGNRNCPQCQNHATTQWLDRQQKKLLPVDYFLVTFTLPRQLRSLAWHHQKTVYQLFFDCVSQTLREFALNPKNLDADIGMTAVLHTHSRRLDYHPHIHVVAPGGGVHRKRRHWKKIKGQYLFNEFNLATVFRAKFLQRLFAEGFYIPDDTPKTWVTDCQHAGKGLSALKYLSRYLYRGVISENNIIANQNGNITFKYTDSASGVSKTRSLKAADFLWLVLQHVLPKGFRRVRDYGFLHGNAKKLLGLVQIILQVKIIPGQLRPRPIFKSQKCQSPMTILGFIWPRFNPG